MYRIMVVASEKENYASLYKFLLTTVDGVTKPLEFEYVEDLDAKLEELLNGDYRKKDLMVVRVEDFSVETDLVENPKP